MSSYNITSATGQKKVCILKYYKYWEVVTLILNEVTGYYILPPDYQLPFIANTEKELNVFINNFWAN